MRKTGEKQEGNSTNPKPKSDPWATPVLDWSIPVLDWTLPAWGELPAWDEPCAESPNNSEETAKN